MKAAEFEAQLIRYTSLVGHYHDNPDLHLQQREEPEAAAMPGLEPTDTTPLLGHSRTSSHDSRSINAVARRKLRWFVTSKYAHYFVLLLVTVDVAGIFGDFLVSLHLCSLRCPGMHSVGLGSNIKFWHDFQKGLSVLSLVISCLFMVELVLSIYAFGQRYFHSLLHLVDSVSIIASFLVDVLSHGVFAEAGSLIIVLRFFRVFKIIEESGTAAGETMNELQERLRDLEKENSELRRRHVVGGEA